MLDFTFKPKITKEFILSKINQESILAHYLKIPIESKKLYRSPFRSDKNPTCALYKAKSGILYFHDFATNDQYNCFTVVMKLYNCDFHKALDIIAQDFGLIKKNFTPSLMKIIPEIKQKELSIIQTEIKPFSEQELQWWNSFGITEKILKRFHVYSLKSLFLNGQLSNISIEKNPMYGYYGGKKDDIDLWRIYFPMKKNFRFLSNWDSKKIQGFKELPKEGNLLIITKSMKDVMTLYSLGIPAIAPNSETLFVSDNVLNQLKSRFKNIIVFYDNDRPGKYNLAKIRKLYPELNYFFIPNDYEAKDISDFYKKYGRNKTIEFVKKYLTLWQEKTIRP